MFHLANLLCHGRLLCEKVACIVVELAEPAPGAVAQNFTLSKVSPE